jgi:hypothetical protein
MMVRWGSTVRRYGLFKAFLQDETELSLLGDDISLSLVVPRLEEIYA